MLKILLSLPLLLVLVLFALSNPQTVELHFWPTDWVWPVPVSLAVLAGMAIAFLIGAIVLWLSLIGARMRARRAEHTARMLEAQVAELKNELVAARARATAPALLPPGQDGRTLAVPSWQG